MFSDGVVALAEAGVVTNKKKTINTGKFVATFLMGTRKLYDFVDGNPDVVMHPVDYTNDPNIIGQHENMVSINSALQVDFMGQVNAEMIGRNQFSGVGGQVDFVRGASRSKGGKSIIALPSTAAKGTVSRIAPALDAGCGRDHVAKRRALHRHRVRGGGSARQEHAASGRWPSSASRTRTFGRN